MTPVFLPRYREARKLSPSPCLSPSQGIPRKGQAPGRVTLWIALGHSRMLPAVFTIKLLAEMPWALFPPVHGGGHTKNAVGVIS